MIFRSKGRIALEQERACNTNKVAIQNKDKNRKRNKIVAFRVTPEIAELINNKVNISGLSKQDYIVQALLNNQVNYIGSPKMYNNLKKEIRELILKIESKIDLTDEDNLLIKETLKLIYEIKKAPNN